MILAAVCCLPDLLLASIGEYMSLPSIALFASALTNTRKSRNPSPNTIHNKDMLLQYFKLLGGGTSDILDFSVDTEIAEKIDDVDLVAILLCLDAQSTLKVVKLSGCINIIGWGLQPFRESTSIRHLDISLVGRFESPDIEVKLSEDCVLSVLQNIVSNGGNSLRYVNFPSKFTDDFSGWEIFQLYLNGLLLPCQCSLVNCQQVIGRDHSTCCECGEMFSLQCVENGDIEIFQCSHCERQCCDRCTSHISCDVWKCPNHHEMFCSGCLPTSKCKNCDSFCCDKGDHFRTCDGCGEGICIGCLEYAQERLIATCTNCKRDLCRSCCDMSSCGNCTYDCDGTMCDDCHPKDWECMWCDLNDFDTYYYYRNVGQKCAKCHTKSTTHCSYCGMVKLRDEDYKSPSVPTNYWTSRGFDEDYVEIMEKFLLDLKKETLKLKSGERLCWGGCISLRYGKAAVEGVTLEHDDTLLPHWMEFIDALQQYSHEPVKADERIIFIHNVQLHSSVLAKLTPILQSKEFTVERGNKRWV